MPVAAWGRAAGRDSLLGLEPDYPRPERPHWEDADASEVATPAPRGRECA
jgi:hypothetical protein